jgi:uncharacterized protein (UPF0332 family)
MQRSEDEYLLSMNDMKISTDLKVKKELGVSFEKTFYYSVISHAYFSIFYSAKAYLTSKGIKTSAPEEHKKTYEEFKRLVDEKIVDRELLELYDDAIMKAESLLEIFYTEKKKRGQFTYNVQSEANKPYAEKSIMNAKKFITTIKKMILIL